LRRTDQVFAEVALLELPVRLAKTMLRVLNWEVDSALAEPAKIRFSQRELANMVGGSRESVNKCLRNWQRTGLVRISGGSIIISDRPALENIAGAAWIQTLDAHRERPRRRCAAEEGDEIAAVHCPMSPVLSTERIAYSSVRQETAALRDLTPAYVGWGSNCDHPSIAPYVGLRWLRVTVTAVSAQP
jgi:Crp-like helix-turn-helix domain